MDIITLCGFVFISITALVGGLTSIIWKLNCSVYEANEIASYKIRIHTYNGIVDYNIETIAYIDTETEDLKETIRDGEKIITSNEVKITALETENTNLNQRITQLRNELTGKLELNRISIEELRKNNTSISIINSNMKTTIESNKAEKIRLTGANSKLASDTRIFEKTISRLMSIQEQRSYVGEGILVGLAVTLVTSLPLIELLPCINKLIV